MNATRNSKLVAEFVKYCKENPEQRFWQAVRNFTEHGYVYAGPCPANLKDTFYWEGKHGGRGD